MRRFTRTMATILGAAIVVHLCSTSVFALDIAQEYLKDVPVSISDFAQNPFGCLWQMIAQPWAETLQSIYTCYWQLFLFLLLGMVVNILLVKSEWVSLLEVLVVGGSFLMVSENLLALSRAFSQATMDWDLFLVGFVPVFAGVMGSGGETIGASIYTGFFLSAMSGLAHLLTWAITPLVECYLAISLTCAFWAGDELPEACEKTGRLMKKIILYIGVLFTAIFSIQRVFSVAADNVVIQAGKTIGAAVPIVGQTLTGVASTLFAGVQVAKTALGFVAIATICASFLPLYLTAVVQLGLLSFAGFLCKMFALMRCGKLFDCLCVAIEVMMAMIALFFFMVIIGTVLMLMVGTGC